MKDFDDPLDLLADDGDGVVEMSFLEKEEKSPKDGRRKNSGCWVVFLVLSSSLILSKWYVIQVV